MLVSRLRSVLGRDRIQHRDRGYLLVCDWLDASELAALTEEMDRRRGAGNVLGAAAAARVALSLLRGYGPALGPRRMGPAPAGRAGPAGRPGPAGGGHRAARGRRLDGRRRRRGRRRGGRRLRRGSRCGSCCAPTSRAAGWPRPWPPTPRPGSAWPPSSARIRPRRPSPSTPPSCAGSCPRRRPCPPAARPAWSAGMTNWPTSTRSPGGPATARPSSSSSTGRRGSGRPPCSAPGPPSGPRPATRCCWPRAGSSTGPCRWMPCSPRCRRCCAGSGPTPPRTCWARTRLTLTRPARRGPGPRRARGRGRGTEQILADSMLGPAVLYAALVRVLARLARRGPLVVVIDDAHLAGPALANWLSFARRENMPAVVVAAVRLRRGPAPAGHRVRPPRPARPGGSRRAGRARPGPMSCTSGPRATRCS